MRLPPLALLLAACSSSDDIGAKEQASVALALQAIEISALAAEVVAPARLDLDEEATTCPAMSRIEGYVTVDYDACVPQRGWVRGAMDGGYRLDLTSESVSTAVDSVSVGPVVVDADFEAELAEGGALSAALDLTSSEIPQARLELTPILTGPLTLTGLATLSTGEAQEVVLDGVTVATGSGCFAPTGGVVQLEQGLLDLTITFGADGLAEVVTSRDQAGQVDVCGLGASLFTE